MDKEEKYRLLRSLMWDYTIPVESLEAVLSGEKTNAGHYDRNSLFIKMLETYPWFTVIQFFTIEEIKLMLTDDVIRKLRMPSLRTKYEFVKKRLHQIIPAPK
jgi:hypothetical protein